MRININFMQTRVLMHSIPHRPVGSKSRFCRYNLKGSNPRLVVDRPWSFSPHDPCPFF